MYGARLAEILPLLDKLLDVEVYEWQQAPLSAKTVAAIVSIDIAASMAAKKSFRIQITSFAAQPVPALDPYPQHAKRNKEPFSRSLDAFAFPS